VPALQRNDLAVGCSAVLVDSRNLAKASAAFGPERLITDAALAGPLDPFWPVSGPVDPDADAALMFTSGSTSRPKVVRVTHRNIQANTESIVSFLELAPTDRVLVVLPFFYCYGASLLHTHLRVGGSVVLCNSFAFPEVAVDMLEREECTVLAGVPSTFQLLLRATSFPRRDLPHLRLVQQAGGRLAPTLVEELADAKPRARLFVMYGQTEATARLSYLPPALLRTKAGSIGKGIPGVELRVLDEAGDPVPPGVRGEIFARGDNISPGYLGDEEASAERFTDGGLRTGDLGVVDEDGFIYLVGRREDFIKSWGHRVSAQEVEACALGLGSVLAAAAVGVPDDQAGEAIVLLVEPKPGVPVTREEVARHCRMRLPSYMAPRSVQVVDQLPVTANGKIDRTRLLQRATRPTVVAAPRGEVPDAVRAH
jgi:acyl-CoA synthetase (AMP-forming)/AMP-acid ligase II